MCECAHLLFHSMNCLSGCTHKVRCTIGHAFCSTKVQAKIAIAFHPLNKLAIGDKVYASVFACSAVYSNQSVNTSVAQQKSLDQ